MSAVTDIALQAPPSTKARGYWATVGRRITRDKVSMACAFILVVIFLSALLAPWLGLADPYQGSMIRRLQPFGTEGHPLGTDELGRDMLTRLIYGGRLSWFMGIVPVALAFVIGTTLGVLAGYAGGRVNMAIMRTTDIFYAFPSVLLAVAISGALIVTTYMVLCLEVAFGPLPAWSLVGLLTAAPMAVSWTRAARDPVAQNCLNLLGATLGSSVLVQLAMIGALAATR